MNYEQAENEIVARMQSFAGLADVADIIPLPDDVSNYRTPVAKALVTTVFLGEKYDANQSVGQSAQHYGISFNVSVQARKLRGEEGVYSVCELVKKALIGFRPTHCGMLTLADHEFADYQNDIWEHSITFVCRSLRTKDYYSPIPADIIIDDEVFYDKNTINENIHL